jgi:hypothetical protein
VLGVAAQAIVLVDTKVSCIRVVFLMELLGVKNAQHIEVNPDARETDSDPAAHARILASYA